MIRKSIGLISLAAGLLVGCNSDTQKLPENCIAVTFVRGICGKAVLKIKDPRFYAAGEDTDGDTHVFLATLECFTDMDALENSTLFYVELNPDNFNTDCAVCEAAVLYSGSKIYNVRVHSKCKNTPDN